MPAAQRCAPLGLAFANAQVVRNLSKIRLYNSVNIKYGIWISPIRNKKPKGGAL